MKRMIAMILIGLLILSGCQNSGDDPENETISIVATTTMITDLVKVIGGDHVTVTGLMQAGVDPHLYQATAGDVTTLQTADLIVFNGIHLESKLADILEQMNNSIKLEDGLSTADLLDDGAGGVDPHIWFSVDLWKKAAIYIAEELGEFDNTHQSDYQTNLEIYLQALDELKATIQTRIAEIPKEQRVLITAHDAFSYFADSNGFEVEAIQGLSTEAEASTADISALADFIADKEIKAIFVESSVPQRTVQALQDAVTSRGFDVVIGGELHSDSLKENSSYIETYLENIIVIVDALK